MLEADYLITNMPLFTPNNNVSALVITGDDRVDFTPTWLSTQKAGKPFPYDVPVEPDQLP